MKRVYTSSESLMVGHLRNILEDHGIRCFVKNEYLSGGAGELPPTECWPEIWVQREIDHERAEALIRKVLADEAVAGQGWTCPQCEEVLEGQFDQCWSCGTLRPERRTRK